MQLREDLDDMREKTGNATRDAYSTVRLHFPDLSEVATELAQPEPSRFPQHIVEKCEDIVDEWNSTIIKIQVIFGDGWTLFTLCVSIQNSHESEASQLLQSTMDRSGGGESVSSD